MADAPKRKVGRPANAPVTGGKGVELTARQALQAAEKATGSAAKPIAKATPVKAAPAKAAPLAPTAPKAPLAAKAAPEPAPVAKDVEPTPVAKSPVAEVPAVTTPVVAPETVAAPTQDKTPTPELEKSFPTATAEGTNAMNDVIENTKKYTEEAKTRFQSAFSEMNEKAKTSVEKSTKAVEEMTEIAKGNVEALVESGKIAAKGIEAMGQDAAEYSRMSFEKASATMKSLAAAKSPAEFFQLQSEMLSSAFDAFAKESAKTSEAIIKLAGEVAQPLSSRVSVVTDKVKSLAA
ncbi:MAG: phasin family protein [Pseudomonadota bacterium]